MREKISIFTDGGARGNPGISGAGVYIYDQSNREILSKHQFLGHKTNNEAEYLAMKVALEFLKSFLSDRTGEFELVFHLDSKLVVEQMNKRWKIKEARLAVLADNNWQILEQLPRCSWKIVHIRREENKRADFLANQAMDEALV